MMKKGFTLAEVLITLTIIGVVAVLTLPALMTNTQEQQARTAVKKMLNVLTSAGAMMQATDGCDFQCTNVASVTTAPYTANTLLKAFLERLSIDQQQTGTDYNNVSTFGTNAVPWDTAVYLTDGTAIYFDADASIAASGGDGTTDYGAVMSDKRIVGIPIVIDTNGAKGPNKVSNCKGTSTGILAFNADDDGDCSDKDNRQLFDQYLIKLRGDLASPLGAATTWLVTGDQNTANEFTTSNGEAPTPPTT